ncbi:hypothetical protein [Tumidithrix helvetica]|uniref:hypothetical protein n=1 Tax=Tumidithrix helvetica TaxID=3457545 RepID=UPI003CC5A1D0
MPQRKQTKGICTYCHKELTKGVVGKHLTTCPQLKEAIAKAKQGKLATETLYHLRVQDAY